MVRIGPKPVDGTSGSRSARRPSVLPLLGVDLRGHTLDSVEALLLLGVRAGIRNFIMSQIAAPASAGSPALWSASPQLRGDSQVSAFAAAVPDGHSWRVNTSDALLDDDLDTPPPARPWVMRPVTLGVFLVVGSVVGFLASFALAVEKYEKLENPDAVLSCDLNPFFSCGSVMEYPQSQLFGFPNQLLGIGAFIFPLLLGVLLLAGARIPGLVMVGLNIGLALGTVLVMFLFYTSIYVIGVGCPWCMVVWTMTIPMFVAVTAHNVLAGSFGRAVAENPLARVLAKENVAISVVWMLLIAAGIVVEFWNFFSTLI